MTFSSSSFGTRILVLKTDGYGPSIKLAIWSLSANSHFSPQSLAQTLLASPPFIRLARRLRARDPLSMAISPSGSQHIEAELTKWGCCGSTTDRPRAAWPQCRPGCSAVWLTAKCVRPALERRAGCRLPRRSYVGVDREWHRRPCQKGHISRYFLDRAKSDVFGHKKELRQEPAFQTKFSHGGTTMLTITVLVAAAGLALGLRFNVFVLVARFNQFERI